MNVSQGRHAIAIFILLSACTREKVETSPASAPVEPPYQRAIVDRTPGTARLADTPLIDAPRVVEQVMRIRPDRRFVNAAADIVEITTRGHVDLLEIEFLNDRWQVRVDRENAAAFPEFVTFRDGLTTLTRFVPPLPSKTPHTADAIRSIDEDIDRFYPRFLFSAFHKLESAGPLDDDTAPRAARAATLLVVQTRDPFDFADPLRGRAMALLAIAKSRDAHCCADTEALLAGLMGYRNEAEEMAAALSPGFARSWVLDEAADPARSVADAFIALHKKFNESKLGGETPFDATIDVEAGQLILENMSKGNTWPFGVITQGLMLRSMSDPKQTTFVFDEAGRWQSEFAHASSSTSLPQYEQRVEAFAKTRATSLVDVRGVRSFYDANFYAALEQPFEQFYSFLGDVPGATHYAATLTPRTSNGKNVVLWMANLVDATYGRLPNDRIASAMQSASLIGGRSRYYLFERIQTTVGSTNELRAAGRDMLATLDSRPSETLPAAKLERYPIADAARRDQYTRAAVDRARTAFSRDRAEMLKDIDDVEGLQKIADDPKVSRWARIEALCAMSDLVDTDTRAKWESLIAADGYKTYYTTCYWDFLNRRKEPQRKIDFAKAILSHRKDLGAVERSNIIADIGDGLEALGQYAQAWRLVEPQVEVYSASILETATSLLQRLGRTDDSLQLGHDMIKRYPEAVTRAYFAPVLWRLKRFDEAAELFDPTRHSYALVEAQHHLSKVLLRSFDDSRIADAVSAFDALGKAHAPGALLEEIVKSALRAKRYQLAYELDERYLAVPLRGDEAISQIRAYGLGYDALKNLRGETAAVQWFSDKMPGGPGLQVWEMLFGNGDFDLLTRYAQLQPPRSNLLQIGSMLAAALGLQRVPKDDPRWAIVRPMIPKDVEPDAVAIVTSIRCLLGETDEAHVAATGTTPNMRAEAAYFLGAHAVANNDYDRALRYFLVAAEGPPAYAPRNWAVGHLYRWIGLQKRWRDIAREGLI